MSRESTNARKIDQATKEALSALRNAVTKYREFLHSANISLAAVRDEKCSLNLVYCRLEFTDKPLLGNGIKDFNYGPIIVARGSFDVEDTYDIIMKMYEEQVLTLKNLPEIRVEARLSRPTHMMSSQAPIIHSANPLLYFEGHVVQHRNHLEHELPICRDLPYFPSADDAIRTLLELDVGIESMLGIRIVIPDPRARINRLHIDGKRIGVEVVPGSLSEENLFIKIYLRGTNSGAASENLKIHEGMAVFDCAAEPKYVDAVLLSSVDGDLIDRSIFTSIGLFSTKEVSIDDVENRLLQIIEGGENSTTEFKRILNPTKGDEYLESVVSFANTNGGLLIVGVDDHCKVVGYDDEPEDSIRNRINALCEPPVEVEIRTKLIVREKPITVIEVKEGRNKPYNLKDSGIFVRRGASDYRISRSELDKIYSSGKPAFIPGFPSLFQKQLY